MRKNLFRVLTIAFISSSFAASAHEWTMTLTTTKIIACNGDRGTVNVSWTDLTAPVSIQLNGVEVGRDEQNGTGSFTVSNVPGGVNAWTVTEDPAIVIPGTTPHSKTQYDTLAEPAAFAISSKQITEPTAGNANGSISLSISGGTAPYTMSWNTNPVQEGSQALNIPAGTYTLSLKDANACLFNHTETLASTGTSSSAAVTVVTMPLYPNPVPAQQAIVHFPEQLKGLLSIYDLGGSCVFEDYFSGNTLQLPCLTKGPYFLLIRTAISTIYQSKIIIE